MSRWIVRYLGCHFGWHGNIMAPDHPKMILGVLKSKSGKVRQMDCQAEI